jgi:hypothetical protein
VSNGILIKILNGRRLLKWLGNYYRNQQGTYLLLYHKGESYHEKEKIFKEISKVWKDY